MSKLNFPETQPAPIRPEPAGINKPGQQPAEPSNQLAEKAKQNLQAEQKQQPAKPAPEPPSKTVTITPAAGNTTENSPAVNTEQLPAEVQKKEITPSERFAAAVYKQFQNSFGSDVVLTTLQKKLILSYFIKIDMILKAGEVKRQAQTYKKDPLPLIWQNVDMTQLAVDVITYSAVDLDPMQSNHLNPIPFKNNKTNKYGITFIKGYRGMEMIAKKYGENCPDEFVIELIYSTDTFKSFKKDRNNPVEGYEFKINNEFDRGALVGGFYYYNWFNEPKRNKIFVVNLAWIEKRKPEYASAEFWGGEKDVWGQNEQGQNAVVGKKPVEGWKDEMAFKTVARAAYNGITIDRAKIDEKYLAVIQRDIENQNDYALNNVNQQIEDTANKKPLNIDPPAPNEFVDPIPPDDINDIPAAVQENGGPGF